MPKCVEKLLRSKAEEFVEQLSEDHEIVDNEKMLDAVTELIRLILPVALSKRVLKEIEALEASGEEFDVTVYLSIREPQFFDTLDLGLQRALQRLRGEEPPRADSVKGRLGSTSGKFLGAFFTRYFVEPRMRKAGYIE